MKLKKIAFASLILILGISSLSAGEYDLPDIEDKYTGTYIPVDYENHFKRTHNIYEAYPMGYPNHHDVLFMGKNRCYADAHFHDTYAISSEEFNDYRFIINSAGTFCIDDKGNSYHKISDKLNERGFGYNDYFEYVQKLLFSFIKDMKTVDIQGDVLTLDGKSYKIILDTYRLSPKGVVLWIYSEGWYALIKNGINGELHAGIQNEKTKEWFPKEECQKNFPLMFLDADDKMPYCGNIPKEQYRYLRNLVYASHGYIFKSEDLNTYFNQFTWYKPNPNFSEDEFSMKEKRYIEYMLKTEKEAR